jgi:hypothetical protein
VKRPSKNRQRQASNDRISSPEANMALQKSRRMAKLPPAWQAHDATNYDSAMTARCTALLAQIISDPARRRDTLADPRNLHHELLASFAPPGHDEYAIGARRAPRSLTEGFSQIV